MGILSQCHSVTVSLYHSVTLSQCHFVTVSLCHSIILSHCAVQQPSYYGMAGMLPKKYTQAIQAGEGE